MGLESYDLNDSSDDVGGFYHATESALKGSLAAVFSGSLTRPLNGVFIPVKE